uniref:(California timema) hypothetical protein n=1 Tax=Timema californicum TaxID=61474 RepID=A0A7R9JHD0_TIMCA|nr:unnamed protein product [Timema californicum]
MVKDEMEEINTSEDKDYNVKTEEHFYGKIETFSEELPSERRVIKSGLLLEPREPGSTTMLGPPNGQVKRQSRTHTNIHIIPSLSSAIDILTDL